MKLLAVFALFCVLAYASADPIPAFYDEPTDELNPFEESASDEMLTNDMPTMIRQRRVTCGLFWNGKDFSFNHRICALKCLAQRRRDGYCHGGICICL
ncbi:defensin-2-like [Odontomachus brunneus]|uniref:defensin-2-like n=1 Tax=Odontomachus brunneus TaxID=486640 RepID=UPI0013F22694|nr:defensin-2-like [Odontomachus brunneus]